MNWTRDPLHYCWVTDCGRWCCQREASRNWSLWKLERPRDYCSGKLISNYFQSLSAAKEHAEELNQQENAKR